MIYTITAYPPSRSGLIPDGRVFGYYPTLEEAIAAVSGNHCDMHEGLYMRIVIEEVPPGIHALATAVQWFWWTGWGHDSAMRLYGSWQPCEAPEWAAGIINHSMG